MEFTIKIDEKFFIELFNNPQSNENPNVYLVPEIEAYVAGEDNDLQYVLFRELGGIDFLDSNNENIDPTDETIDWDNMIYQATELFINFYNLNIKK
jgi:hypothetical protein